MNDLIQNMQVFSSPVASEGEISAVALLKLMMRAESSSASVMNDVDLTPPSVHPINDRYDVAATLSPYLQEQLQSIAESIFDMRNYEFYCSYRGIDLGQPVEFFIDRSDLRALAYRALMYESFEKAIDQKPFSPRFASSLLLLQKYWDCQFLQAFKDVAGRLTPHSMRSLFK